MEPLFCSSCGEALPSGVAICGHCGARTVSVQRGPRAEHVSRVEIFVVALLVLALGFGAYLYFRPSGTPSPAATALIANAPSLAPTHAQTSAVSEGPALVATPVPTGLPGEPTPARISHTPAGATLMPPDATLPPTPTPVPTPVPTPTPTLPPLQPVPTADFNGWVNLGWWTGYGPAVIQVPGKTWYRVYASVRCPTSEPFSILPWVTVSNGSGLDFFKDLIGTQQAGPPQPVTMAGNAGCHWILSIYGVP